jgi:hypothetical protein
MFFKNEKIEEDFSEVDEEAAKNYGYSRTFM